MSQTYFPAQRVTSPVQEAASFNLINGGNQRRAEDVQEAYVETREKLVGAIDATSDILSDLRSFNNDEWVVRYPQFKDEKTAKTTGGLRRSVSFVDDPDVVLEEKQPSLTRSASVASFSDSENDVEDEKEEKDGTSLIPPSFQVLRLDLRVDPHSSQTPSSLVQHLSKSSIASLLSNRIGSSLSHLNSLRTRVEDTESKILVTGDLNAGKSTFVNALLRREVMPVDQQPCTKGFWEVRDASETGGSEEVHLVASGAQYDIKDETTYTRRSIDELDQVLKEIDEDDDTDDSTPSDKPQRIIKLYLSSPSALFPPSPETAESEQSQNPLSISLIDAPGLNTSSLSTSLLFSLQPSIDVIVFLISASNHFTLSSKEFLFSASQEKAHIFVVVNKFKEIKDKEKCVRRVLDQIKVLSPKTWEERDELVHFVDSGDALVPGYANPSFDDLESSLKSFVFMKRSKSKFLPAKNYLNNVLADIELLARANALVAKNERLRAQADLDRTKPVYESMLRSREELDDSLAAVEDSFTNIAERTTKNTLKDALDAVGRGEMPKNLDLVMPSYPGLLGVFDFAKDVRQSFLKALDDSVKNVEDVVRNVTSQGVDEVKVLSETHLPADVPRSKRVFMPEAMFRQHPTTSRSKSSKTVVKANGARVRRTSRNGSVVVAGGVHGLGIGLVSDLSGPLVANQQLKESTLGDVFDLYHQLSCLARTGSKEEGEEKDAELDDDESSTALSLLSLGGAASISLTMLGGQALGVRGLIHSVMKVGDILSNEDSRKWVAPILAVGTLGLGVWVVWELPQTIPRTVGRRVRREIVKAYSQQRLIKTKSEKKEKDEKALVVKEEEEPLTFQTFHAHRISSETRKVLRLASWDLRERFRSSLEERGKEVKGLEEGVQRGQKAEAYFVGEGVKEGGEGTVGGVVGKVRHVRKTMDGVGMA